MRSSASPSLPTCFCRRCSRPVPTRLIIIGVTTLYTVVGGLYSVVIADVIQFLIKIVCCVAIGFIAMRQVSPEALAAVVPAGWTDITFGWTLDLDWSHALAGR